MQCRVCAEKLWMRIRANHLFGAEASELTARVQEMRHRGKVSQSTLNPDVDPGFRLGGADAEDSICSSCMNRLAENSIYTSQLHGELRTHGQGTRDEPRKGQPICSQSGCNQARIQDFDQGTPKSSIFSKDPLSWGRRLKSK